MRNAFAKAIHTEAMKNSKILLLTGDLGYSAFEQFQTDLPKQYINCGVAEQNMVGVAAGLSHMGFLPIVYSIVPFATMRSFEQIRNDIYYPRLNVKIVGVGAGFSYGTYGFSHYGLEDVGIMRALPNMTILSPCDPIEVTLATRMMLRKPGPMYLRLAKAGEPILHTSKKPVFTIGKMIQMSVGKHGTIFATSIMVSTALAVSRQLARENIHVSVFSVPTIAPIDRDQILKSARSNGHLITFEEGMALGGLGSAVSDVIAEQFIRAVVLRCGVSTLPNRIGLQAYMRKACGLDEKTLLSRVREFVKKSI